MIEQFNPCKSRECNACCENTVSVSEDELVGIIKPVIQMYTKILSKEI